MYIDQNQIIATRIFIFIFTISLILIGLFSAVIPVQITVYANASSYEKYLDLHKKYDQNLACPCTSIDVLYSDFMDINVLSHQICFSIYVDPIWISTIYGSTAKTGATGSPYDFRLIGIDIFEAIKLFCQLANDSIEYELQLFKSQQFISRKLVEENAFLQQINASFNAFIKSIERYLYINHIKSSF